MGSVDSSNVQKSFLLCAESFVQKDLDMIVLIKIHVSFRFTLKNTFCFIAENGHINLLFLFHGVLYNV